MLYSTTFVTLHNETVLLGSPSRCYRQKRRLRPLCDAYSDSLRAHRSSTIRCRLHVGCSSDVGPDRRRSGRGQGASVYSDVGHDLDVGQGVHAVVPVQVLEGHARILAAAGCAR